MSNIFMNRDLVRSAVLDVENFLQSNSADDDTMNSLKLIKHAIVALDNLKVNYDIRSTSTLVPSAQDKHSQIQSDISSGTIPNADLKNNWSFTLKDFADSLLHSPLFSQCCARESVHPFDTERTESVHVNDTNLPSDEKTAESNRSGVYNRHFIGKSKRNVTLKDECVEEYMRQLGNNWHLDILALANLPSVLSEGPIISIGRHLLKPIGDTIDPNFNELVLPVLRDIQDVYIPNPYHNALHGAMVGHLSQVLFKAIRSERAFTPYEELGYVLAALGHDAGHPGKTNTFLSLTSNPLALIYNDNSILENYHSSLVFHIIRYHSKFFNLIPSKEWEKIRKRMIQLILSTDMTTHFTHINNVKARRESGSFDIKNDDDFWLLMVLCIKVADIGHNFLPWVDHISWTSLLFEEFYLQGDEERFLSMPLLLFFDRTKAADIPDSQLGFFQGFTKPLLDELTIFENESKFISRVLLGNAEKNLKYWKDSSLKNIEDILRDLDSSGEELAVEDQYVD
ncbi:3',5' cyclic nucleotide phosphodiesterase, putative [Theileria equi strain WA]|uniref:3',5' cyclic nucleotide phosphodiesterase, putative n=1 Tax=Theileria equi strain WA TaxID=1537102 RepID=L1LE45_THEEQ|nr:3',5' cyclic nucleotide phosphodiesterase, putative [Theileria equi strain WA]EKX73702.1 3',5' cyclic nucleotide phosphodiesterase, putative [Theileria equi strain WA]|eukprot:XP_004833154.1 3',5' cyclic nucleotide phosphodiesterase, putative [Theileria equi strain WA]